MIDKTSLREWLDASRAAVPGGRDVLHDDRIQHWKEIALARVVARKGALAQPRLDLSSALRCCAAAALVVLASNRLPVLDLILFFGIVGSVRGILRALAARAETRSRTAENTLRAEGFIDEGAPLSALRLACSTLLTARSPELKVRLRNCIAWAGIGLRDAYVARRAIMTLAEEDLSVHLVASYLAIAGRIDESIDLLEQARALGHRTSETSKLHLDLLVHERHTERAHALAYEDAFLFRPEEMRRAMGALADAERRQRPPQLP